VALRGTLKEFRIADIFQLVSQQAKTGTLRFRSKGKTVWVSFLDGWIVRVEDSRKSSQETICDMLLCAELVHQEDLDIALDVHKTTGRSLSEVLSLRKLLPEEKFNELVLLQMREALYELFFWDSGQYEFDAISVLSEGTWGRLNAEWVLMDGFRVVDEWPEIRKAIPDESVLIETILPFPEPAPPEPAPPESAPPEFTQPESTQPALTEPNPVQKMRRSSRNMLGVLERQAYEVAKVGFTVKKVMDLSCLGRFDGLRALVNLVEQGCIRLSLPLAQGSKPAPKVQRRWVKMGSQIGIASCYLMVVSVIGASNNWYMFELGSAKNLLASPVIRHHIARAQKARIEAAIEVYRLENATVPEQLEALVEAKLLNADDLRHPWHTAYYYSRKSSDEYQLLLPFE
jgi:hypothetical protein